MRAADLPAVAALADAIHPGHPERPEVFAERLALFPRGCWMLEGAQGYAVAHPWAGAPPALDTLLGALPPAPECLYWHDLALAPEARGQGAGRAALALLAAEARRRRLPAIQLVAVSGSAPFWQRLGFRPAALPGLGSYGAAATGMRLALQRTIRPLGRIPCAGSI